MGVNKKNNAKRMPALPALGRRGLLYSLVIATVILLLGGLGFLILEPKVSTLADGLWLAFTTAATVGYGDIVPSTMASKVFSVLVVLLGLAVLSLVTASVAALFVERDVQYEERMIERELIEEIRKVRDEVRTVREELAQLRAAK
jgi:voltage-gated potassium channel